MHHHIFSSQDTFIYNFEDFVGLNFGLDESLAVQSIPTLTAAYQLSASGQSVSGSQEFYYRNFTGIFTGSTVSGTASYISGQIQDAVNG